MIWYKPKCDYVAVCEKGCELEMLMEVTKLRRNGSSVATTQGGKIDRQIRRMLKDFPDAEVLKFLAPSSKQ